MGGSPPGTVRPPDEAWRSAFESVFLGAIRLARALAADLGGVGDGGAVGGSLTGAGGSIVLALASRRACRSRNWPSPTGCSPAWPGWSRRWPANSARPDPDQRAAARQDRHRQGPGELDALRGDPDEVRARLSGHIPLRRYGEPEEFGRAAVFALSPAASYITGAMIPVDGGAISSI